MRLRIIGIYDSLISSFWFLPAVMALAALAAALGTTALDHKLGSSWVKDIGWVWAGGADGARSVLSTVAGSLMTVISIVFSLTITTLAQTSSHFGPRVLRNFTSDRGNQFVLGTFIATFVYCLIVLRTVRSIEESPFVPYLSVNIGIALALASLAVLIYFIHHISQSIQAENLIAEVGRDFQKALPHLFPEEVGHGAAECEEIDKADDAPPPESWKNALPLRAPVNGYLQRIDDQRLMELAKQEDLITKLLIRPGGFVTIDSAVLLVLPAGGVEQKVQEDLAQCFAYGPHRTSNQDALYSVQQMVEIAARALSPGVNEPFTALTCIDWLGAALRGVASRNIPSPLRRDEQGKLRVIADTLSFEQLLHAAFGPIRAYGAGQAEVAVHLLKTIASLAPHLQRKSDNAALVRLTQAIGLDADSVKSIEAQERVQEEVKLTLQALAAE